MGGQTREDVGLEDKLTELLGTNEQPEGSAVSAER